MKIEYDDPELDSLAYDPKFIGQWTWDIKRRYQKAIIALTTIKRRESLFPLSGMNFELLPGKRKRHRKKDYEKEYSIRLDRRWRVVLTFYGPSEDETIIIIDVEDYH
jgi:proteic killer suppression protein